MKLLRRIASLLRRSGRRLGRGPYVGRRDHLSQAGERALFDTQMRSGF